MPPPNGAPGWRYALTATTATTTTTAMTATTATTATTAMTAMTATIATTATANSYNSYDSHNMLYMQRPCLSTIANILTCSASTGLPDLSACQTCLF